MKKLRSVIEGSPNYTSPPKLFFIMKLTLILFLGMMAQVQAVTLAQYKVNLRQNKFTYKNLFEEVERQTGVITLFSNDEVDMQKQVNVPAREVDLQELYRDVLRGTDLDFRLVDGYVVIKPRAEMDRVADPRAVVQADQKEVKGVVVDEAGTPLIGVNVYVKGTTIGATTNDKGEFVFRIPGHAETLVVSYVGFEKQEIAMAGKLSFSIALKPDVSGLEEVVVTGYQQIEKERATGSFEMVSRSQLEKPASNIASRLIGTVTGVQAKVDAEGNPTFEVRGKSSLFANSTPLVVVDGFAIEGDFSSINPNDVESVTILKDAAAASIWGARSANGVIVVTTKSGSGIQKGKIRVTVNSFVKHSGKPDLDYLLNKSTSEELVAYERFAFNKGWKSGRLADRESSIVSTALTQGMVTMNEQRLGRLTTEEMEAVLGKLASQNNLQQIKDELFDYPFTQQHNINIASSSQKSNSNLSLMYEGNETYLEGNDRQTVMINYRNFVEVFKWMDFNFSGMFRQQWANNNARMTEIQALAPYDMLVDSDGNRESVQSTIYRPNLERYWPMSKFPYPVMTYNPITEMENRDLTNKQMQSRFQAILDIRPVNGITLKQQVQYETFNTSNKNRYTDNTFETQYLINSYTYWNRSANTFTQNMPSGDILDRNSASVESWTYRSQISLDRTFGKHAINAVGGLELSRRITQTVVEPRVYGYDDDLLTVKTLPNGLGSYTNPSLYIYNWYGYTTTIYTNTAHVFTHTTDKYLSAYFNAAYTFDDKYTLSASARTDASNLITDDPKYRYSPFWSLGAGWQATKEEFLKEVAWLDRLNLRATFGYNGNVDRSTSFLPLININPANNVYTNEPYATVSSYGNPTLRWEKTGTLNIGIDYSLFSGKLFGKADFYRKDAKDLIAPVTIPSVNGVSSQKMNVANMTNKGIEVEIATRLPIRSEDIVFYANLNLSYNSNKITKLYRASFTHNDLLPWGDGATTTFVEGENANTIYGSHYAGLRNDGTDAAPNMQPKIEGKDGTLYGFATWPADNVLNYAFRQGTTVAPWVAGLSFGLKVHDFDISVIMTGKFGHVFRRTSFNYNALLPNSQVSAVMNGNPDEILPLPQNDNESRFFFWDRFWKSFSYLTEPADHIRMQEINLTYNLPARFLSKTRLSSVKLYAQANNVFAIYANKSDEDPEFPMGTFKPVPVFTYGINIGF